jgi:hypothetical protein
MCAGLLDAAGLPTDTLVTATQGGLRLQQGQMYKTVVRGTTAAGRWVERQGPTLLVDATPPAAGTAQDGITTPAAAPPDPSCAYCNADVDYTADAEHVRVRGVGFTDPESGVARFLLGASSLPCDGVLHRACPVVDPAAPVYTQLPCSPLELRWRAALAARLGVPLAALGAGAGRIPFNASDAAAFDVAPLVDLGAAPAPSNTWALPAPLPQGAIYFGCVIAENGAGLRTLASTNGVVVDGTPPSLTYVADGLDFSGGTDWQSSNILDGLAAHWVAGDDESGLLWSEVAFTLDPSPVSAALAAEGWSGDARRASGPLLPAAAWDGVQSAIAAGLSDAGAAAKSPEELSVAVALAAALPPVNLASPFGTAGIANLVVRGGLNLSSGVPYFAVVRARNKAGAYSRVLASDGCVVGRATLPRPPLRSRPRRSALAAVAPSVASRCPAPRLQARRRCLQAPLARGMRRARRCPPPQTAAAATPRQRTRRRSAILCSATTPFPFTRSPQTVPASPASSLQCPSPSRCTLTPRGSRLASRPRATAPPRPTLCRSSTFSTPQRARGRMRATRALPRIAMKL